MSACFTGEYEHRLDNKGRLIVPSKLREELGSTFMLAKGIDYCLYIYPNDEWERVSERLSELPMTNKTSRAFKRTFNAGVTKCEPDNQGRIMIPTKMREYAKIDKDVVVIGNGEKAEIWSKEQWDAMNNDDVLNMDELAAMLDEMGFRI